MIRLLWLIFILCACNSKDPRLSALNNIQNSPQTVEVSINTSGLGNYPFLILIGGQEFVILENHSQVVTIPQPHGSLFEAMIIAQPTDSNCMVLNPFGIAISPVSPIEVRCGSKNEYFIGGRITGLKTGSIRVKNNNTGSEIEVASGQNYYAFPSPLLSNSYDIELDSTNTSEFCFFSDNNTQLSLAHIYDSNILHLDISCYPSMGSSYFGVSIEQAPAQMDPTSNTIITFDVFFSRDIDPGSFTASDIYQAGSASISSWTITQVDYKTFRITAQAATPGSISPSIAENLVQDYSGNSNSASFSSDGTVIFDNNALSATINQASGQADPVNTLPVSFTITFSKPIDPLSFTDADVTESGTANGITWDLSSSDNVTFNLSAVSVTTPGTLIPNLAAGTVLDPAGNANVASTSTDNSVTYDQDSPFFASATVTNSSPTNSTSYNLTYGTVTGTYDFYCILENSTVIGSCSWLPGTLPATFIVTATENAKVLSIWVRDFAGNVSTRVDTNSVTLDTTAPLLSSAYITNASPTNTTTFNLIYGSFSGTFTDYCILENSTLVSACSWVTGTLPTSYVVSGTQNDKILSIWLRDAAGNVSSKVSTNSVTYTP